MSTSVDITVKITTVVRDLPTKPVVSVQDPGRAPRRRRRRAEVEGPLTHRRRTGPQTLHRPHTEGGVLGGRKWDPTITDLFV